MEEEYQGQLAENEASGKAELTVDIRSGRKFIGPFAY